MTVKTFNGVASASVKTVQGDALASVKTFNGEAVASASTFSILADVEAGSSDGSTVTTASVDSTNAKLIVLVVTSTNGSADSTLPTDSASNTWTALTVRDGGQAVQIFYCVNPTTSATHTFSVSGGSFPFPSVFAIVAGGPATPSYDQESGTNSGTQPGSLTPSTTDCLVVSGGNFNNSTPTSATGMTLTGAIANDGNHYAGGAAYVIQTSATAVNPTWDQTGSIAMAVFKP